MGRQPDGRSGGRGRRGVGPKGVITALVLAVLLGVSGGLLIWDTTRPASLIDLIWCRNHPEEVGWAAIAFDIDLGEEGAAEACSLARDVGAERLRDLIEGERTPLRGDDRPDRTRA